MKKFSLAAAATVAGVLFICSVGTAAGAGQPRDLSCAVTTVGDEIALFGDPSVSGRGTNGWLDASEGKLLHIDAWADGPNPDQPLMFRLTHKRNLRFINPWKDLVVEPLSPTNWIIAGSVEAKRGQQKCISERLQEVVLIG